MNTSKVWLNKEQWLAEGKRRFSEDFNKWAFVCPSCNRIQTVEEFKQFKDKGVDPNDAYQQCIGRFTGGKKGPHKCDWAAFGLFKGPDFVKDGHRDIAVFSFAPELKKETGV